MTPFSWTFRVRWHDCDPQGIVFNGNYLAYASSTWSELFRAAWGEGGYDAMVADLGVDLVMAETTLRFLAPARHDDLVEMRVAVTRVGTSSVSLLMSLWRDDTELVGITIRSVCVDSTTLGKTPIPPRLRIALSRYAPQPVT